MPTNNLNSVQRQTYTNSRHVKQAIYVGCCNQLRATPYGDTLWCHAMSLALPLDFQEFINLVHPAKFESEVGYSPELCVAQDASSQAYTSVWETCFVVIFQTAGFEYFWRITTTK